MTGSLFEDLPEAADPGRSAGWTGAARVSRPDRRQVGWEMVDLDQLLAADHPARLVSAFVDSLDLSGLYGKIEARTHGPGRDAIAPELLLALWLYATIDAVGSAREVARLCERDLPYRWLCGGVGVNHHALSDFRSAHVEEMDRLLTDSVTALMADGLVSLQVLAHDSVKVRASAGAGSFRRSGRLAALHAKAAHRVAILRAELDGAADASVRRKAAATLKAQEALLERVAKAQERARQLEKARARQRDKDRVDPATGKDKPVRASTTDPDARILKMASGESRPAYSLQITADPNTLVAVGVSVHDSTDFGQLGPALEQVEARYGQFPKTALADCGFCSKKDISFAHQRGVTAVIPSNRQAKLGDAAYATTYRHTMPGIAQWRERMVQQATKDLYKLRCRIECIFGQMRNRGLRLLRLRGKHKVKGEALIHLLAHNMICAARLRLHPAPPAPQRPAGGGIATTLQDLLASLTTRIRALEPVPA
jgi:transposase